MLEDDELDFNKIMMQQTYEANCYTRDTVLQQLFKDKQDGKSNLR